MRTERRHPLTTALDGLLDLSVVVGYSRFGYGLRRHWWPADPPADALRGRAVAVTGANSGLGKATVAGLASLGADVLMLCRDGGRGATARGEVAARVPGARLDVVTCDVSDLDALPAVADEVARRCGGAGLRALVHNAGVMPPERTLAPSGHELALTTHVLGPHVLTHHLRPALAADGDARVVLVTSGGMYTKGLDLALAESPEEPGGTAYSGVDAYARTKRMQVHLAESWAQRLRPEGIAVHSTHPGWADTPGVADSLPGFRRLTGPILRDAAQGADTAVWLAAAPQAAATATTGLLWHDRRPRPTRHPAGPAVSPEQVAELWRFCVAATGVPA